MVTQTRLVNARALALLAIFAGLANACTRECRKDPSCGLIGPPSLEDASVPQRDSGVDAGADAMVPLEPPIAIIHAPPTAPVDENIVFDGSASFDPQGLPLTFRWRLIAV